MGWFILGGIVLFVLSQAGGSTNGKDGKPPPPPPPPPGPQPQPQQPLPSLEQIATVICVLFKSTHAAAPPGDIVSAAYVSLGTDSATMQARAPQIHMAAVDIATQLYNGTADCTEPNGGEYAASVKLCSLTGKPYNAALWHSPPVVLAELVNLGFDTGPNTSLQRRTDEVKRFQALARSMGLGGYANAPASFIDGVIGACTLVALEDARLRRLAGTWPFALVTGLPQAGLATKAPTLAFFVPPKA